MKIAFAYLRVIGKGQIDGDGFPRQLEAVRRYAAANNIKITKVFKEEGVSGVTDWESRPAFTEMMVGLLANGTHTVLVERLDRVARDLMIQESIIADFQRKGLTIESVAEPDLCSTDPSRVLMRQMMGAFFQYEKTTLVAKLKAARQRIRAKVGVCEGRKPYGAMPGESDLALRMKDMREQGNMGWSIIAKVLNDEGLGARKGRWHANSVRRAVLKLA
jgi:DNA invertase Pin-like site-specific DNA recombinase